MKKEKKQNKYLEVIKNLWKSPRGKAIVFFLLYFIFFFVLIVFIRGGYEENPTSPTTDSLNTEYKITGITNGNYHFTREEVINGITTTFTGDKNNNKTNGLMATGTTFSNYFIYDNINLIQIGEDYEVAESLYHFNNLTDDQAISKILKNATLISKTEYEIGTTFYNYQISTNTLDQLSNNTNIDIADIPNNITLETNEDNEVVKITYDLSSYATYIYQVPSTVNITISYSNFGEIGEIAIPENG